MATIQNIASEKWKEDSLFEESAQQTPGQIIHNRPSKSTSSICRSLAEPIATGESYSIRNRQNQGNRYNMLAPRLEPREPVRTAINLPTRLSQITLLNLIIARIANPTQSVGATYRLSQKNRLSVAAMVRVLGSDDSKTMCESPVVTFTSFHQRSPTRRRPAMFLR